MIVDVDLRPKGMLARIRPPAEARVNYNGTDYSGGAATAALEWMADTSPGGVLVIIHGYASKEPDIRGAYGEIGRWMVHSGLYDPANLSPAPYGLILRVFWPGHTKIGYHLAEMAAEGFLGMRGAGDRLADLLRRAPRKDFDFLMHSAGNRVGLDANRLGDLRVRHMLLCAAAVDDDSITAGGEFYRAVQSIRGKALAFHSRRDAVLAKAYRLAKLDRALGYSGPQPGSEYPSTLQPVDANGWIDEHSAFRRRREFYAEWAKLVA